MRAGVRAPTYLFWILPSVPVTSRPIITCRWIQLYFVTVFFFKDTATTEIYTLSLHDALPICWTPCAGRGVPGSWSTSASTCACRSEEHTSELQSRVDLVCCLLLEIKKDS